MTVNDHWLPVETMAEKQLVSTLVRERRSFLKLLRYDLHSKHRIPCAALIDRGDAAELIFADDRSNLGRPHRPQGLNSR